MEGFLLIIANMDIEIALAAIDIAHDNTFDNFLRIVERTGSKETNVYRVLRNQAFSRLFSSTFTFIPYNTVKNAYMSPLCK